MIKVHIDGSARPNPGIGGCGIVFNGDNFDFGLSVRMPGKKITNNEAEYYALVVALINLTINRCEDHEILIISDSEMLVKQMKGEIAAKDETKPYMVHFKTARRIIDGFADVKFKHVPREQNAEANELASRATRLPKNKGDINESNVHKASSLPNMQANTNLN